ncbi:MAG: diaminopimelate epimerase [Verrucomicrobia bacterium]|nr:diaminopimelate epimerase [Verrucomicrobiota bacterium]
MHFSKYHALGNDYLVLDPANLATLPSPEWIERVCHRNFGLGSDGILHGPLPSDRARFGLRIYNPDGSEAEKSGNGLRIFARYLFDQGLVSGETFTVDTPGGVVACTVQDLGRKITVEMGKVQFLTLNGTIELNGRQYTYHYASIGNPHCVVPVDHPTETMARELGPLIENDPRFPNRTNVQFLRAINRNAIEIQIWERGAGYTLASGSSSSAAGAVAHKLGLVDSQVTVHMPGGLIELGIAEDYAITMTGPTTQVASLPSPTNASPTCKRCQINSSERRNQLFEPLAKNR